MNTQNTHILVNIIKVIKVDDNWWQLMAIDDDSFLFINDYHYQISAIITYRDF